MLHAVHLSTSLSLRSSAASALTSFPTRSTRSRRRDSQRTHLLCSALSLPAWFCVQAILTRSHKEHGAGGRTQRGRGGPRNTLSTLKRRRGRIRLCLCVPRRSLQLCVELFKAPSPPFLVKATQILIPPRISQFYEKPYPEIKRPICLIHYENT